MGAWHLREAAHQMRRITETMEWRPDIGLDSYDRLFPNQDTMPHGGFGNLIALPLQKGPRDQGNSVFLDDKLVPWADQWVFLASVRKIGRAQVEGIVQEAERPLHVTFQGELRPEQTAAADAMLAHDTGVLAATTAFGKTVIAAWLLAQRGVSTLVLVHRRQLLDQWIKRLSAFLGVPAKSIGRIGGRRNRPTGLLDVAVIQSLVRKGVVDDRVADYGHLVVDECHHLSAHSFELVARQAKARFVVGLSATVARKDGHHPIIFMQCGPVRHRVNARAQAAARPFDHLVLVQLTDRLAAIPRDEARVILATGKYVGEGFDDPRLDTLFLTLPVSWRGTVAQYAGRLHRLYDGKREVRIYDYADLDVLMLARMFDRRCRGYEAVGYEILLPASAIPGWPTDVVLPSDPVWKRDYFGSVRRLVRDGVDVPLASLFVRRMAIWCYASLPRTWARNWTWCSIPS